MPRDDATFVLCIEDNAVRPQALLLCESIRAFGGRLRDAPIVAVAPRPGLGVDGRTRRRLAELRVEYVEEPLNRRCPEYGSANRVYAAAWAERRSTSAWVVVLDSDTVFLEEPELPSGHDAAVRPVDVKGCATAGPGDRFEAYWSGLAGLAGVSLERLPYVRTTVCGSRVRACYNGGLVVARRRLGMLAAWAELFSRSVDAGLRPWRGSGLDVRASTGFVGAAASEYWGSNQAAAALAIWGATSAVLEYPAGYNAPLHLLAQRPERAGDLRGAPLVHVHYHWLFTAGHHAPALATLAEAGLGRDRLDWLRARLPLAG